MTIERIDRMKGLGLTIIFGLIILTVCVKAFFVRGMERDILRYDPSLPVETNNWSGCYLDNLYFIRDRLTLAALWRRENLDDAEYLYLAEQETDRDDYRFKVIAMFEDRVIKSEYSAASGKVVKTVDYSIVEAQKMFDSLKLKPGETRDSAENIQPGLSHSACEFRKYMRVKG